jgi:hypothetical protein
MSTPPIAVRRNVVEPIACIKAAWELVKDQYWLFVGMCAVGLMIGSAIPFGILLGPMMCGLYLSFFKLRRREPIEFGTLFKGFDYFGASVVAALLHILPIMAIIIPGYVLFYVGFVLSVAVQGDEPNPAAFFGVFGLFVIFWIVMFIVMIFISVGFMFAYPLIVDRKLQGVEAVKWSFRGAMANFWRLLLMMFVTGLLSLAGMLLCYVGMFLVFPIGYGAVAIAYEQVYGLSGGSESDLPPPPPSFN